MRRGLLAIWLACCAQALCQPLDQDVVLKAMRDELKRSRDLKVVNLETPYYIEYALEDGENLTVTASLGGLIAVRRDRYRLPDIKVRVGDYKFDNTNYVGSGFSFGSQYDVNRFPLEDVYPVLRRYLWLATDTAYKSAVEAISRKRAALKNIAVSEQIDDFALAVPVKRMLPVRRARLEEGPWIGRVRSLSAVFAGYPEIKSSNVELQISQSAHYLVNSEGTEVRFPEPLMFLRARASAQSPDGMTVRDAVTFHTADLNRMPAEPVLRQGILALAEHVTALARAPRGEMYSGPILFEGMAAAQLLAEVLGRNLVVTRRPVTEPGRPGASPYSELEGRLGARILPEWMHVVDDPTQKEWRGKPLFGSYEIDREGVVPQALSLVEKGVLKKFLLTRQPVRGFEGSNGRARMPGNFGANMAEFSNLFVRATETVPLAALKKKMMDICETRDKPYGIIVREMDFPSSASVEEVRRMLSGSAQAGGGSHPVSMPLLVYRVFRDGREELVRGLRFRGLNARSLKDIVAAADDQTVFDFLDNSAPFALMGAGNFISEACVIAPSILIDDLELHPVEDEMPKLPIVPAPDLRAAASPSE